MGFFSWITQDTNRSICNTYSGFGLFNVIMMDNKGNKWVEDNYEGYGVFGGKDYYELLAEMNGVVERDKVQLQGEEYTDYMRGKGIDLAFKKHQKDVIYPNLVESENWVWRNTEPVSCPDQGYFYAHDDETEHDYLW